MARLKKLEHIEEIEAVDRSVALKQKGNGYIPVKCEDTEIWYDPSDGKYFAIVKINDNKYTLEQRE